MSAVNSQMADYTAICPKEDYALLGGELVYTFSAAGRIVSSSHRNSHLTSCTYHLTNHISQISDKPTSNLSTYCSELFPSYTIFCLILQTELTTLRQWKMTLFWFEKNKNIIHILFPIKCVSTHIYIHLKRNASSYLKNKENKKIQWFTCTKFSQIFWSNWYCHFQWSSSSLAPQLCVTNMTMQDPRGICV